MQSSPNDLIPDDTRDSSSDLIFMKGTKCTLCGDRFHKAVADKTRYPGAKPRKMNPFL